MQNIYKWRDWRIFPDEISCAKFGAGCSNGVDFYTGQRHILSFAILWCVDFQNYYYLSILIVGNSTGTLLKLFSEYHRSSCGKLLCPCNKHYGQYRTMGLPCWLHNDTRKTRNKLIRVKLGYFRIKNWDLTTYGLALAK